MKDISVWSISNPHLTVAYERKAANLLSVDSWVDINSLEDANPIQEVCKRGFAMPEGGDGLLLATGNIRFDPEAPTGTCTRDRDCFCRAVIAGGTRMQPTASPGTASTFNRRHASSPILPRFD